MADDTNLGFSAAAILNRLVPLTKIKAIKMTPYLLVAKVFGGGGKVQWTVLGLN